MATVLHKSVNIPPLPGVLVIVGCVVASLWQLGVFTDPAPMPPIDTSDIDQVVGNCLGEMEVADAIHSQGDPVSKADFTDVCLPPLSVAEEPEWIVVTSPESRVYGFAVARLNRATLSLEIQ